MGDYDEAMSPPIGRRIVVTLGKDGRETQRRRGRAGQLVERLGRVTLEMVQIPGGAFLMGTPEGEADSRDSEQPQHQVTVPDFYLGKYAVTIEQWRAVMGVLPPGIFERTMNM